MSETSPTVSSEPATAGLRERKKQRRRSDLHEAALQLVESHGLDGTTVEQICEAVGVSPRTFFNYFPSKSAAALNLPEHIISPEAASRFRGAEGELIPALCTLVASSMNANVDRTRIKALVAKQPELMPAFGQWMATVKDEFANLVAERAASRADASAAVALTLSAISLQVNDQAHANLPADVLLLHAVDRIVGIRSHALVPVHEPEPKPGSGCATA